MKNPPPPTQIFFEDPDGLFAETLVEWDRQLHFDTPISVLKLKPGESTIDRLDLVEDTKGNNGQRGSLTITNMRLIWAMDKRESVNLSVGLNTIVGTAIRPASSKLMANSQSLIVNVTKKKANFEFIFTHLVPNTPRMFVTVQSVIKANQTTRLYRELKIRGTFMRGKNLQLLPDEMLDDTITGVWNLSGEHGHLGAFQLTNLRVVWYSMVNDHFNMSLPYRQMVTIRTQASKYGNALVIETSPTSGHLMLGFRVDPESRLSEVAGKIRDFWKISQRNPVMGIRVDDFAAAKEEKAVKVVAKQVTRDDITIVDHKLDFLSVSSASSSGAKYTSSMHTATVGSTVEGSRILNDIVVYDRTLGLAIERLPEGVESVQELYSRII